MSENGNEVRFRLAVAKLTITYGRIQIIRHGMPGCLDPTYLSALDVMFIEWAETVLSYESKPAAQITTADIERLEAILTAQEEWLYQPMLMDALKHLAPDYAPGHLRLPAKEPD